LPNKNNKTNLIIKLQLNYNTERGVITTSNQCINKCQKCGKTAKKESTTAYQLCRELSRKNGDKVTQAKAAEKLNISVRQLSAYETGEAPTPDDMVVAMAEYYETPILIWYHMKHHTVFGAYLPEVPELKTIGDIVFEGIREQGKYQKTFEKLLEIADDFKITQNEIESRDWCVSELKNTSASLLVMSMCAAQLRIEE
jgi:transcriptional regulator with XRE-family HTH domain